MEATKQDKRVSRLLWFIIGFAIAVLLFGCSNDDNECTHPKSHWETVTCDTEDNIIKINNVWLQNSNLDWNNWQYLQTRGFRLDERQLRVVTTDGSKILQAELFNVNPESLYITRPNESTVVFYSTDEALMNAGDVYYVNLKIVNN